LGLRCVIGEVVLVRCDVDSTVSKEPFEFLSVSSEDVGFPGVGFSGRHFVC
jgi:hypothetical protein